MTRLLLRQIKDYARTFIRPVNLISSPEIVHTPPGNRIVVLSPHFDDDVIGCGGTLYKHIEAHQSVSVIYLTDGKEGDPSVLDKNHLSEMRKEEARRATTILGIENLIFLDEPETQLRSTTQLISRLQHIVGGLRPDLLYIPSFLDNHIDHFEANRILLNLSKHLEPNMNVAAYEVWTPLLPNTIVDITSAVKRKEEALKQYETQIRQVDYVRTTLGLNKYRSAVHFRGQGYAEAFLVVPVGEYTGLMKKLRISRRAFLNRKRRA